MKKNVPKFVLATNEAAQPGKTYIVHTQAPSFIAELIRFNDSSELENYLADNSDKEIIKIDSKLIVELKKYLESPDTDKRRGFLNKRIKDWVIANYIK